VSVQELMVACGPPGLKGGRNILYHNNGDGTSAMSPNRPESCKPMELWAGSSDRGFR
jgi:hypothetical protein